jgi:hypothetical protein
VSAFLLFAVQPLIGKTILPWFGSTPGVWTTCLLFFQTLLLLGYAWAHLLTKLLSRRAQVIAHGTLLVLCVLLLPIAPAESMKPAPGDEPVTGILLVLLRSVGGPFFLLAATAPLLQAWFARTAAGRSPYPLYALSNLGSFLALFAYPLVIERFLRLRTQAAGWSLGWLLFAAAVLACALRFLRAPPGSVPDARAESAGAAWRPGPDTPAFWVLLSAAGSGILVATTNLLCLDIAAIPFLWVLPLGIYLLTFVLCFGSDRVYARPLFCALLAVALCVAVRALFKAEDFSIAAQVGSGCLALFSCGMACHGELARLRPPPERLTAFYLAVSFGGALGGLFVAVVAPAIFADFREYHLLLLLCAVLVFAAVARDRAPVRRTPAGTLAAAVAWLVLVLVAGFGVYTFLDASRWPESGASEYRLEQLKAYIAHSRILFAAAPILFFAAVGGWRLFGADGRRTLRSPRAWARAGLALAASVGLVALVGMLGWAVSAGQQELVAQDRNFYGVLRVDDYGTDPVLRSLTHGRIEHGCQVLSEECRAWPITYYPPESGIGLALRLHPERDAEGRQFRIGVIGLGTGTIAAYANAIVAPSDRAGMIAIASRHEPGDHVAFYDINPLVVDWARRWFTYLADAEARGAEVAIHLGDARIVLERQIAEGRPQNFDVLAVDAFSSDAIPIHLLTDECFALYKRHLAPGGILAIHVTNRHLELSSVARRLAREHDLEPRFFVKNADSGRFLNLARWVLATDNLAFLEDPGVANAVAEWPDTAPLWTDDWSSILPLLRLD